jgi:hypothetical protein
LGSAGAPVAAAAATPADATSAAATLSDDSVTLYGPAGEDLLVIRSIEREGNSVVVKGQAYGSMPLTATLRPEQARRLFKLLKLPLIPFLVSFLFRKSKPR